MNSRRLEMVNQPSDPAVPRQQFMQQRYELFPPARHSFFDDVRVQNPIQRVAVSTIKYRHI